MHKISEVIQQGLTWVQPSMTRRRFELRAGDDLVGTLNFPKLFGTLAEAESGDGAWTFKRIGFWQQKATVRVRDAETDLAVFTNNTWTGGGTLAFAHGSRFKATTNFWRSNYQFQTETEQSLVRFASRGVFRQSAEVEAMPEALRLPELPLLVLFGWYLVVMLHADAAAAAAV
jgi:hypothetical protein